MYWRCYKDHSWLASIASESLDRINCPYCGSRKLNSERNLATKFPKLVSDWNYEKMINYHKITLLTHIFMCGGFV